MNLNTTASGDFESYTRLNLISVSPISGVLDGVELLYFPHPCIKIVTKIHILFIPIYINFVLNYFKYSSTVYKI